MKFLIFMFFIFLNCKSTNDLPDVPSFMIEKQTPDLLTLPTTFYYVSIPCDRSSKAEMRQLGTSGTKGLKYLSVLKCNCMEETGFFRGVWTNPEREDRNLITGSDNRKCTGSRPILESWTNWMSSSTPQGVQVGLII